jgi:hypothetical protein
VLRRSRHFPRAKTIRPAEPYLLAGADEARRLGHNYIGTEHILSLLVRDQEGGATRLLGRLGVIPEAVEAALASWLVEATPAAGIDPQALAELGIDFDMVRKRLEQTFGPGALERTQSACLGICPRLKLALAYALDHAKASASTIDTCCSACSTCPSPSPRASSTDSVSRSRTHRQTQTRERLDADRSHLGRARRRRPGRTQPLQRPASPRLPCHVRRRACRAPSLRNDSHRLCLSVPLHGSVEGCWNDRLVVLYVTVGCGAAQMSVTGSPLRIVPVVSATA